MHEYGHFFVARRFGVKVLRFSIGFGKKIFSWRGKDDTEYVIAMLPLGGYVKMLDSREMEVSPRDQQFAFDKKKVWQKFLIIIAGPITNVIFAFFAFWLIFVLGFDLPKPIIGKILPDSVAERAGLAAGDEITFIANRKVSNWQQVMIPVLSNIGNDISLSFTTSSNGKSSTHLLHLADWRLNELQPNPIKDLGIEPYHPPILPIIDEVERGSPADQVHLQKGDVILAVDGKVIHTWEELVADMQFKEKQTINLTIARGQKIFHVNPVLGWRFGRNWQKVGYLGIAPQKVDWPQDKMQKYKYSASGAIKPTWQQIWDFSVFNYIIIGKLFTGKVSFHVLGGPITIFQSASTAFAEGLIVYIGFLAILSLMLALINLLPLPGLDGGYAIFFIIELLRRKPISVAAEALILRLGLIILILIMFQATINDLMRMF